ncbi:MAG TPA: AAA family ATPase [Thermomicrobiales bacterium]|nr:AAA family ATPase [Thermomicrobiales bacterium]
MRTPISTTPPFVGRLQERAVLRSAAQLAAEGSGRLVLLGGEAGIGKTALVRDLASGLAGGCFRVITGHCFDLTNTGPYAPWLEIVRRSSDDTWPVVPEAFRDGQLGRVSDQTRLVLQTRQFLEELATKQPLVVVLEDVHWADPSSVELLRSLTPHLEQASILVVATYRVDEMDGEQAFSRHLPALVRSGATLHVEIGRLEKHHLRELIQSQYTLPNDDLIRLVSYLDRNAEGVPFFAVELLHALEADGLLRRGTDLSSLGELDRVVVPRLTRQVIEGRVSRLSEDDARLLSIAAVIGHEIPLAIWQLVGQVSGDTMIDAAERLVNVHLLEAERSGTSVRFVHALTREAIYEGVVPFRRRQWHQAIGEALTDQATPDPDAVAFHFAQAGDPRAVEWMERSAERAWAAYAWVTAAERLRAASALSAGNNTQTRRHHEALFRYAFLRRFSDPMDGVKVLTDVIRWAEHADEPVFAAEVEAILGVLLCYADRFNEGVVAIERSLLRLRTLSLAEAKVSIPIRVWTVNLLSSTTESDPAIASTFVDRLVASGFDTVHSLFAWYAASAGRLDDAKPVAETFLAAAQGVSTDEKWIQASIGFANLGLGIVQAAHGEPLLAQAAWHEASECLGAVQHYAVLAFARLSELREIALTYQADEPSMRRALATEAEEAMAQAGGVFRQGVSPKLARLSCLVLDGEWTEADAVLRELPNPGVTYLRREIFAATQLMARFRGQTEVAWQYIHIVLPMGPATEPGNCIHQEGLYCMRTAIHLAIDMGDLDLAASWLKAHDRWLAWNGAVLGKAAGELSRARLHLAAGGMELARDSAVSAIGLASNPNQPLIVQAAQQTLAEVALAEGDLAAATECVSVAVEIALRCEAPLEHAQVLLIAADLHVRLGNLEAAHAELQKADAIASTLQATVISRTVASRLKLIASHRNRSAFPAGLTAREVDVLHLLWNQQTDKEIAESLFISPHTVSTHVKHVLAKLDVSNRRDAVQRARDLGVLVPVVDTQPSTDIANQVRDAEPGISRKPLTNT